MGIRELLLLAVGLSMDAFAVAVCKGLSVGKPKPQHYLLIGLWFGGFQALMPTVGYFLGSLFKSYVDRVSSWIAFVLLMLIGANMIREAFSKETNEEKNASFAPLAMLLLAIATSIDALAVGVAFAMDNVNIALAAPIIGVATFLLSALGLHIGSVFGLRYKNKAEFVGGLILILIEQKFCSNISASSVSEFKIGIPNKRDAVFCVLSPYFQE